MGKEEGRQKRRKGERGAKKIRTRRKEGEKIKENEEASKLGLKGGK